MMRLPVLEGSVSSVGRFESGPRSIAAVRVLRISITDRCNFRCLYCMPEEGMRWLPRDAILSFEEIRDVVQAAIEVHGIRRFKLTGGEPTVRYGLVDLVRMLRRLDGIEDLSLTTNGMLLEGLAHPLRESGLDRITVSIDSLRPERFRAITRTGDLATVMRGLDACEAAGLASLKINCVTMRNRNDDEFADFARLTLTRPVTVRFIEYMPLGDAALMHPRGSPVETMPASRFSGARDTGVASTKAGGLRAKQIAAVEIGPAGGCGAQDRGADAFIPEGEVRGRIERELGPLEPVDRQSEPGVGPAIVYRLREACERGRIGFISAMSAPFCSTCNRLRLTAEGVLRSCLFDGGEVNVLPVLRSTSDELARRRLLAHAMTECVRLKPDAHSGHGNRQMSQIGG